MKINRFFRHCAVATLALTAASFAQAGLVYTEYFGEDPNANGKIEDAVNSVAKRDLFRSQLIPASVMTESFETFTHGDTANPSLGLFGPAQSLLTGGGMISNEVIDVTGSATGRFNTTPNCDVAGGKCNWWETSSTFNLMFDKEHSAFGFFGSDFSDFGATVWLDLLYYEGGVLETETLLIKEGQAVTAGDEDHLLSNGTGSLLFFGFTDDTRSYAGVTLRVQQQSCSPTPCTPPPIDVLGFDDLILGDVAAAPPGTVPEPTSLALVGLSLLGLAASRRKRQA